MLLHNQKHYNYTYVGNCNTHKVSKKRYMIFCGFSFSFVDWIKLDQLSFNFRFFQPFNRVRFILGRKEKGFGCGRLGRTWNVVASHGGAIKCHLHVAKTAYWMEAGLTQSLSPGFPYVTHCQNSDYFDELLVTLFYTMCRGCLYIYSVKC